LAKIPPRHTAKTPLKCAEKVVYQMVKMATAVVRKYNRINIRGSHHNHERKQPNAEGFLPEG